MTESSPAADQQGQRYPSSFTQEWFLTLDKGEDGGTFGRGLTSRGRSRRRGLATGEVRWLVRHGSVLRRPAVSWPVICADTLMGGGRLMIPGGTGGAGAALGAFPGIAGVLVIEPGAGRAGRCLAGCVVPSGPGLEVTAAGAVRAVALPGPELGGLPGRPFGRGGGGRRAEVTGEGEGRT